MISQAPNKTVQNADGLGRSMAHVYGPFHERSHIMVKVNTDEFQMTFSRGY
jgi:hypothetical protein